MSIVTPTTIDESTIYGYVYYNTVAVEGATVTFTAPDFMLNDNLISIDVEVTTDSAGRFSALLPETVAVGVIVTVLIEYESTAGLHVEEKESIVVGVADSSVQAARAVANPPVVITGGAQGPAGPQGDKGDTGAVGGDDPFVSVSTATYSIHASDDKDLIFDASSNTIDATLPPHAANNGKHYCFSASSIANVITIYQNDGSTPLLTFLAIDESFTVKSDGTLWKIF